MKKELKNLLIILVSSMCYAAGISLFLDPNNLAPGGITGISVILNRLSGIETGTLYFLINVPIILLGTWKFGVRFISKTAYTVALTSFFTNYFTNYEPLTTDPLLAAAAGGCLVAFGIGTIFKAGATTGGVDIIIKVIRLKYRHLKTGFLFQTMDMIVVTISGFVFKNLNTALYALIAVLVCGKALDYVLYGGDEAKLFYIITDKPKEIGKELLETLNVGITYLQGRGGFTGTEKDIIFCVARKQLGPKVEEIVKAQDPAAFLIISSASEIYGKGYKDLFADSL